MVRTRFAPSPTGYLHVGGARTAIFNYLYSRHTGGKFLLRIEDTDRQRYKPEWVDAILNGLKWLGLEWDEDVVFQSERLERYREVADELIDRGKAYRCYCTPEELEAEREEARRKGVPYRYSRKCLHLSDEERWRYEEEGRRFSVRFYVPDNTEITFHDIVHGDITYNTNDLGGDFIIVRSDGFPTYNFAVVVDDHDMGVTHVVRGDDHIPNTPKQILIYKAMGWDLPQFAHLPMILGPDRQKLSKRHGSTSLEEFRIQGILPEALFNYLLLLGWSPGDNREIISKEEAIKLFDLKDVNKSASVFDHNKLYWMNSEYIRSLSDRELLERLREYNDYLSDLGHGYAVSREDLEKLVKLFKERAKTLRDFFEYGVFVFSENYPLDGKAVKKRLKDPNIFTYLRELATRFERLESWKEEEIERVLRGYADELGVKHALLIHATRVAVSGVGVGPSLFLLLEVLGKDKVVGRLKTLDERVKGLQP
ncbi:MAG: glutamate--tRNA ligase [Thermotogae bacterium]|nr:glutamate--tRNA ligase [Thermotogota bacterium]